MTVSDALNLKKSRAEYLLSCKEDALSNEIKLQRNLINESRKISSSSKKDIHGIRQNRRQEIKKQHKEQTG